MIGHDRTEQPRPPADGPPSSERLRQARVLVVGVGGLGCPAALYLSLSGIGTLGLIDPDAVELSNLHRQILHSAADIGTPKVESARAKLSALTPHVTIRTFRERLTADNLVQIFREFDFVIDGTDNVAAKFLINDGAILSGTPYSHAGVLGFRGQTMTVLPRRSTCYRCLFPVPPPTDDVPTCHEAGVVGVVAGALGIVQAGEAIKYALETGGLLTDLLLTFDAITGRWRRIALGRNRQCPVCGDRPSISTLSAQVDAA